jgi:hypothetical protein
MIVSMHQPNFLPWLGYFYKMAKADLFIFTDTLEFSKGSYTQRVKIMTASGPRWLTVPLIHIGKVGQPILEVRCGGWSDWRQRLVDSLNGNYLQCQYYRQYADPINAIIMGSDESLCNLNIKLILHIAGVLGITLPTVLSSTLPVSGRATDWIISACKAVGADTFLSGLGGAKYQDEDAYGRAGIKLIYTDFRHPRYPQKSAEFVEGLSIVDLLYNCGPGSAAILKGTPPP